MDNTCLISAKFKHASQKADLCAEDDGKLTLLQQWTRSDPKNCPSRPKTVLIHALQRT